MARTRGFARRTRRTRRPMRAARRSGVGRIRRRMARRVRSRRVSRLNRKAANFGPHRSQKLYKPVSRHIFQWQQGIVPLSSSVSTPATGMYQPSYTACGLIESGPGTATAQLQFVDQPVRDRWLSQFLYARLKHARFTITWRTPNPGRDAYKPAVTSTITGAATTYGVPTAVTGAISYGVGAVPPNPAGPVTISTPAYAPVPTTPCWRMHMIWDPENLYDGVSLASLRRQGITVRTINLRPGKRVSFNLYPFVKTLLTGTAPMGTTEAGAGSADRYAYPAQFGLGANVSGPGISAAIYQTVGSGTPPGSGTPFGNPPWIGQPVYLSRPKRFSSWQPCESWGIPNVKPVCVGWRVLIESPYFNGFTAFVPPAGEPGWRFFYDIKVEGHWEIKGRKWQSALGAMHPDDVGPLEPDLGADPDDHYNDPYPVEPEEEPSLDAMMAVEEADDELADEPEPEPAAAAAASSVSTSMI